jgi:phage terminase large subunit
MYLTAARAAGCPTDQVRRFAAAGYAAQPKQLRFHALARLADATDGPTQLGYGGARGGAKSHATLAQIGLDDCQRYAGIKVLLLRRVGKAVRESFEDLRIRVLGGVPHDYRRSDGVLEFSNGSKIVLGHFHSENDIDSYLGLEYDVIAVEEATTLSTNKYKAIRTCLRTSKLGWRPRMYSTTNPGGIGHAWYKAMFITPFRQRRESDTRFVPATVDDNRFVNPEYRKTLDELTGWQKRAWRFGDWDIAAGQFFTTWREAGHVVPGVRGQESGISRYRRFWGGLDYGFTHFTAAYLFGEDGDGRLWVLGEHAERRWLPARHVAAIRSMVERQGLRLDDVPLWVAGRDVFSRDRDGKSIADDYAAAGLPLEAANDDRIQGAAELLRRLGDVDAGLAPSLFISDTCARLTECMPAMEHDPHRPEDVLKVDCDDDGNGGDDFYDALRYGVMAATGVDRRGYAV